MKTLIMILCLLPLTAFAGKGKPHHSVHVRNTHSDVFYFKVDAEFWGANVEVLNEKNEVILSHHLSHKKALIDFYFENPGQYTIRFIKDEHVEEFQFEKTGIAPEMSEAENVTPMITIIEKLY